MKFGRPTKDGFSSSGGVRRREWGWVEEEQQERKRPGGARRERRRPRELTQIGLEHRCRPMPAEEMEEREAPPVAISCAVTAQLLSHHPLSHLGRETEEGNGGTLRYLDTPWRPRIRIGYASGYGYVSDTPRYVSRTYPLFLQFSDK